jgi:hypothetical protein
MIEVLSVITVGMNGGAGHVYPHQSCRNHADAGLLKHFSDGTVRRVFARFDHAGNGGRCLLKVGASFTYLADDADDLPAAPQLTLPTMPTSIAWCLGRQDR